MEILKLLLENPGSGAVVIFSLITFIFYCGSLWVTMRNMKDNMVTKVDLSMAILTLKLELASTYVAKEECEIIERRASALGD